MKLMVLQGSSRPQPQGAVVAKWVMDTVAGQSDISAELVNAIDLELPFYNEAMGPTMLATYNKPYSEAKGAVWAKKVGEFDAFIFISPEYNHSTSAVLKNAIDWVGPEWAKKPVAFISYGYGASGGRAVEHLRQIVNELRMVPLRDALLFDLPSQPFDSEGKPNEGATKSLTSMLTSLAEFSEALKPLRS